MKRSDLDLRPVLLLDRVQKHQRLAKDEVRSLKSLKLIEGRAPNYHISAKVADWTGQKARYIHNRGLDDDYYNPDWALLVKKKRCRTIILVVETKGGLFADDHRDKEKAKMACRKAHFKALEGCEAPARYLVARSLDDVITVTSSDW